MKTKFIFVTGGVLSSLGKGLSSASIGAMMEARGLTVANLKLDPYINVDPGTMSPYQHGEVYVTDDGAETDLDLYTERSQTTQQVNNFTTGKVYDSVIRKNDVGDWVGRSGDSAHHQRDQKPHPPCLRTRPIFIVEVGGTVGDIEPPFLEAIRQLRYDLGAENCLLLHVIGAQDHTADEVKTVKRHSVKESPDWYSRTSTAARQGVESDIKQKIALFCTVPRTV